MDRAELLRLPHAAGLWVDEPVHEALDPRSKILRFSIFCIKVADGGRVSENRPLILANKEAVIRLSQVIIAVQRQLHQSYLNDKGHKLLHLVQLPLELLNTHSFLHD